MGGIIKMPYDATLETTVLELEIEDRLDRCVALEKQLQSEQGAIATLRARLAELLN